MAIQHITEQKKKKEEFPYDKSLIFILLSLFHYVDDQSDVRLRPADSEQLTRG